MDHFKDEKPMSETQPVVLPVEPTLQSAPTSPEKPKEKSVQRSIQTSPVKEEH